MLVDRPARHVPHAGVSIWSGLAAKASPFSSRPSTSRTRRARCAWCCRSAAYSQRRARGAVYSSIIIVIARQVQAFPWRWWVALVLRRGATPSTRPVTSPTVARRWCRVAARGRCCRTGPRGHPCGRAHCSVRRSMRPPGSGGRLTVRRLTSAAAALRAVGWTWRASWSASTPMWMPAPASASPRAYGADADVARRRPCLGHQLASARRRDPDRGPVSSRRRISPRPHPDVGGGHRSLADAPALGPGPWDLGAAPFPGHETPCPPRASRACASTHEFARCVVDARGLTSGP